MTYDVWPAVHAERRALVDDLRGLTPEQWATPSLCAGWSVHDVLAHALDAARTTRLGFLWTMAISRFDFDRQNERGMRRARRDDPAATLAAFAAEVEGTKRPPGPLGTRLVEAFVHGEDIRRPLGITGRYPADGVAEAVRTHVGMGAGLGGAKELVAGLRLQATDTELEVGDGALVEGPATALLLAACGRTVALPELTGPGVELLTGRL